MMGTVDEAIRWAREQLDDLDAEVLLADLLGWERGDLLARGDHPLDGEVIPRYEERIRRRAEGEPVAYLTGRREFLSLDFLVDPRVLIPRPETEILAEEAIAFLPAGGLALDVGTGSGALAVVLAREVPGCRVIATDISRDALEVARTNASRHGVEDRIELLQGDLVDPLRGGQYEGRLDIIVSNPPYVDPAGTPADEEVARYEPGQAVYPPGDPLEIYRRLVTESGRLLRPGGMLACEVGIGQARDVAALFGGLQEIRIRRDLAGIERVVTGRRGVSEEGEDG
jgi:release factor glutamine methyltransferase